VELSSKLHSICILLSDFSRLIFSATHFSISYCTMPVFFFVTVTLIYIYIYIYIFHGPRCLLLVRGHIRNLCNVTAFALPWINAYYVQTVQLSFQWQISPWESCSILVKTLLGINWIQISPAACFLPAVTKRAVCLQNTFRIKHVFFGWVRHTIFYLISR
jgi:hypothetical protein